MSVFHTPRMPAWSPPDSLSGTPTSSAGSLPRTPTDDASHPPLKPSAAAVPQPARERDASSSSQARPQAASQPPSQAAQPQVSNPSQQQQQQQQGRVAGSSSTSQNTPPQLPLAQPFSQSTPSALAGQRSAPPLLSQPSVRPLQPSLDAPHNTASSVPAAAPRVLPVAGPGTPKPSTSALASSSSLVPPPPPAVVRKRRKRSTPEQIEVLERHFAANDRPTSTAREAIAKELDMTARQVQIWMQNRRQTRKKRMLEAAGQLYRPTATTAGLGGQHPSSDSVGSIPSSEMDDLPFDTVYGARRVINKENRPLPATSSTRQPQPASGLVQATPSVANPTTQFAQSVRRSPSAAPSTSRIASTSGATISAQQHRSTSDSTRSSHSSTTLLDKCVQSRELPFVHQKRSAAPASAPSTSALPIMGWQDEFEQPRASSSSSSSGRDVWQHMMSDPPSGGLLELHEDEAATAASSSDEDEDVKPAKFRRTSSTSSAASSSHLHVGHRSRNPSLPAHLEPRTGLRRAPSLDCAASRSGSAGSLKRPRTALGRATPSLDDAIDGKSAKRRASRDRSVDRPTADAGDKAAGGPLPTLSKAVKAQSAGNKHDATDVEAAHLLMGLLGGL